MKRKQCILGWSILLAFVLSIQAWPVAAEQTSASTNLRVWTQIILDNQSITPIQMFFPEEAGSMQGMLESIRSRHQIMATMPQTEPVLQIPEQAHLAGVKSYAANRSEYDNVMHHIWYTVALTHEADFRRLASDVQNKSHFADGLDDILWTYLKAAAEQRELTNKEQEVQDQYMKRNREPSGFLFFNVKVKLDEALALMEEDSVLKPVWEQACIQHFMTEGKSVDPALAPVLDSNYVLLVHSGDATSCPLCHPRTEAEFVRVEAPYAGEYNYSVYRASNPDLQTVFGEDRMAYLNHWLASGRAEGRTAK